MTDLLARIIRLRAAGRDAQYCDVTLKDILSELAESAPATTSNGNAPPSPRTQVMLLLMRLRNSIRQNGPAQEINARWDEAIAGAREFDKRGDGA